MEALSSEILLNIFQYLDVTDLINLKKTCKRFNLLINKYEISIFKKRKILVTNQISDIVLGRCHETLRPLERCRISNNWKKGRYKEKTILKSRFNEKFLPCLHLGKNYVWISRGQYIRGFSRVCKNVSNTPQYIVSGRNAGDVTDFVVKNGYILSAGMSGMWMFSLKEEKSIFDINLGTEISSVDFKRDIAVTGSRCNNVAVFKLRNEDEYGEPTLISNKTLEDRIWSISLQDNLVAAGTSANNVTESIFLIDTISNKTILSLDTGQYGAGVLKLKWEDQNILWSAGYDTSLRKWDTRIGQCILEFPDPHQGTIYTFDYDYVYSVLTGCDRHGRVVLWDTRQNKYVQMYFMQSSKKRSSPIYSLSFDAKQLFCATDQSLNILDFSIHKGDTRDYSNLYKKEIIL